MCCYFLTEMKKKIEKGKRFICTVGKGKVSWKASSIYDKGTHILQSDLCFDMEEWRSDLLEGLKIDNLESRNIALGTLPLALNPGVESLMYDEDTQNLQSNVCSDVKGMAT
ncbi:unnamed protein product [Ilex paraguariensis]|uniref:Uncharacterized protein n=1 Tax=Ilex paraguariensis TaxID=185542 RepID=A0ABC8RG87_9AQUA